MSGKRDCYDILGVSKSADDSEIKKAYRKLAKKYHPDTNAGDASAEQKFKEITEAYSILSDPKKRKMYDQFGYAAFEGGGPSPEDAGFHGGFHGGGFGNQGGAYQSWHFQGGDMGDIFEDLFGFGSGRGARRGRSFEDDMFNRANLDINAEISISFDDAAFGCAQVIRFADENGRTVSLQVHIPAGIDEGKTVRLKGKGHKGSNGTAGDLLLKVHVGQRMDFERKGMDVYSTAYIPYTTAVFGGEAEVDTLKGKVRCSIRPYTQAGSKIRLKGKGIVDMNHPGVFGDQYVTIQIKVPSYMSEGARKKLKEFEEVYAG